MSRYSSPHLSLGREENHGLSWTCDYCCVCVTHERFCSAIITPLLGGLHQVIKAISRLTTNRIAQPFLQYAFPSATNIHANELHWKWILSLHTFMKSFKFIEGVFLMTETMVFSPTWVINNGPFMTSWNSLQYDAWQDVWWTRILKDS